MKPITAVIFGMMLLFGCLALRAWDEDYQNCLKLDGAQTCGQNGCAPSGKDTCLFNLAENRSDKSICSEINENITSGVDFARDYKELCKMYATKIANAGTE